MAGAAVLSPRSPLPSLPLPLSEASSSSLSSDKPMRMTPSSSSSSSSSSAGPPKPWPDDDDDDERPRAGALGLEGVPLLGVDRRDTTLAGLADAPAAPAPLLLPVPPLCCRADGSRDALRRRAHRYCARDTRSCLGDPAFGTGDWRATPTLDGLASSSLSSESGAGAAEKLEMRAWLVRLERTAG